MEKNEEIFEIIKIAFKDSTTAINDYRRAIKYYVKFAEKKKRTDIIMKLTREDVEAYFTYIDESDLSITTKLFRKRAFRSVINRISEYTNSPHLKEAVSYTIMNDRYYTKAELGIHNDAKECMSTDDVINLYKTLIAQNDLRNITLCSLMLLAGFSTPDIINLNRSNIKFDEASNTYLVSREWMFFTENEDCYTIFPNYIFIMNELADLLTRYLNEYHIQENDALFRGERSNNITQRGIDYIVKTISNNRINKSDYDFYRADLNYIGSQLSLTTPDVPLISNAKKGEITRSPKPKVINNLDFSDLNKPEHRDATLFFTNKSAFNDLASQVLAISIYTNNKPDYRKKNDNIDYYLLKADLIGFLKDYLSSNFE